jgi:hypothetical protein
VVVVVVVVVVMNPVDVLWGMMLLLLGLPAPFSRSPLLRPGGAERR